MYHLKRNSGGATRDRTADLLRARQALSQLSYSPFRLSRFHFYPQKGFFAVSSISLPKLTLANEVIKSGKMRKSGGSGKI